MAVRGRKPGGGAKKTEALIPLKELTPVEAEARRTQLKNLIILGKERGFLTYAEINDHLPDEVLDADQIEGVISMINDMGIQVYDEAPNKTPNNPAHTAPIGRITSSGQCIPNWGEDNSA